MSTVRLTQITDLHLGATKDEILGGVTTYDSFLSVLQASEKQGHGDNLLLLTGDLASDSQPGAYRLLNKVLDDNGKKAVWLPGNHDHFKTMQDNLRDYPFTPVLILGGWGILLLDSSKPDGPGGHFSDEELARAEAGLAQLGGKPVLVAMHHSPVAVNSTWLDRQRIDNQQKLYAMLLAHGQVKAVITGHVHQHHDSLWHDIPVYSSPSSCVQFEQYSHDFALSDNPPGYRWIELHEDGSVHTGVEFLQDFTQRCDVDCVGY